MTFDSPVHPSPEASDATAAAVPTVAAADLPPNSLLFAATASLDPVGLVTVNGKHFIPEDKFEELKQHPEAAFEQLDALLASAAKHYAVKIARVPLIECGGGALRREWRLIKPVSAASLVTLRGRFGMYPTEDARVRGRYRVRAAVGENPPIVLHDDRTGSSGEIWTHNEIVFGHSPRQIVEDIKRRSTRPDIPVRLDDGREIILPGAPQTRGFPDRDRPTPRIFRGRIEILNLRKHPRFRLFHDPGKGSVEIKFEDDALAVVTRAVEKRRPVTVRALSHCWKAAGLTVESYYSLVSIDG